MFSGKPLLLKSMRRLPRVLSRFLGYSLAVPLLIVFRLISRYYLVRFGLLISQRIGHFAANTEIYLCERDVGINAPAQSHFDLFCMSEPVSNHQLAKMWKRTLHVGPTWLLAPLIRLNRLLPGGRKHEVGPNTQSDRDVFNLLDRRPAHLAFTLEEQAIGERSLRDMGVSRDARIVCLIVRDDAYLSEHILNDWSGHSHRNSSIHHYALVAKELAVRGYTVVRMGAKVSEAFTVEHPCVIDYATNGMRSEFMDIYLGKKCEFCVSTGTGWDAVPAWLFRKPIVYVNYSVIGLAPTFCENCIFVPKKYRDLQTKSVLSLREILMRGASLVTNKNKLNKFGIELVENTDIEILDAVLEMAERLNNSWVPHEDDEDLQRRFKELFPVNAKDERSGRPLHGEIRARIGAAFLRENREYFASDVLGA